MLNPELFTTNLNVFCYGLKEACLILPDAVIDGYIKEIKEYTQNCSGSFIYYFVFSNHNKPLDPYAPPGRSKTIQHVLDIFVTHESIPFNVLGKQFRHIGQIPDIQAGIFNRLPPIFNRHYEYEIQSQ